METTQEGPPPTAPRPLQGLRIRVVEDDPEWCALVVDELARQGAAVRGLGSVEALYRELAVDACDIVVLDVTLPGEDGFSATRHLRRTGDMGIVLVTGRGAAADMAHGLSVGADVYLPKPLELPVLVAALHSLHRRMAARTAASPCPAPEPAPPPGDGGQVAGNWGRPAATPWPCPAPSARCCTH